MASNRHYYNKRSSFPELDTGVDDADSGEVGSPNDGPMGTHY